MKSLFIFLPLVTSRRASLACLLSPCPLSSQVCEQLWLQNVSPLLYSVLHGHQVLNTLCFSETNSLNYYRSSSSSCSSSPWPVFAHSSRHMNFNLIKILELEITLWTYQILIVDFNFSEATKTGLGNIKRIRRSE